MYSRDFRKFFQKSFFAEHLRGDYFSVERVAALKFLIYLRKTCVLQVGITEEAFHMCSKNTKAAIRRCS